MRRTLRAGEKEPILQAGFLKFEGAPQLLKQWLDRNNHILVYFNPEAFCPNSKIPR